MEKYESKQYRINRPAEDIYGTLSDFTNFTPVFQDKIEDWQATENSCSFNMKGFTMRLDIIDKVPFEYVKVGGGEGTPIEFILWLQLKQLAPDDTRIKLTLHAELNMIMKMMLESKLREGIDQVAAQIADAFNGNFGNIPGGYDYEDLSGFDFSGREKLPS